MDGQSTEWRSYATICRLCLQKDGFMLGIFNNIQGKDKSISKKIVDCTALSVHHGDGLPNVICHRCLFKIEFCLEFRQLCFLSDATLRQFHGNSEQVSKENESDQAISSPLYEQLVNGGEENVVMVVDPNQMDYESEVESDNDRHSDVEAPDLEDDLNDTRDECRDSKGVSLCRFCDHAFTDHQECLDHENNTHNVSQPYNCASCSMDFADRMLFSAHMKSVHKNDKPYNCPQCSRCFARRSDLRKHTVVHTGVKPYTCTVCFKSFSRNTNLSKHMRIHLGAKPFVCQKCPRTFTSKGDLNRHAMIHTGQKPFRCRFCNLAFSRKDKMLRHEKRHLLPGENNEEKLDKNVEKSNLECGEIANSFLDSSDLVSQEENSTTQESEKPEEKMVINLDPFNHDLGSGSEPSLQKNVISESENNLETNEGHAAEELSDNNEDNSEDDSENNLNGEQKSSASEVGPYQCLQCPITFSNPDVLRYHVQVNHTGHGGPRPFNCTYCNKSFIRKRELERHVTVHTGLKPFKCPKCHKGFSRKDKLVRHVRIHDRPGFPVKNGFFGFSSPEKTRPLCLTRDK